MYKINFFCHDNLLNVQYGGGYVPPSCSLTLVSNKDGDVTVQIDATDGISPYNFLIKWDDGNITQANSIGQYSHLYTTSGNYNIILNVQDSNNSFCTDSLNNTPVSVIQPLTCTLSVVDPFDPQGTIDVLVQGGKPIYTVVIKWGDGASETWGIGILPSEGQYSHKYAQDGDYVISITLGDSSNQSCTKSVPITVSGGSQLSCVLTLVSKSGLTANFNIAVSGGTSPYNISMQWGGGEVVSTGLSQGAVSHTYKSTGSKFPTLVVGNAGTTYPQGDCFDVLAIGI